MAKFFGDEGKVNVLCCELDCHLHFNSTRAHIHVQDRGCSPGEFCSLWFLPHSRKTVHSGLMERSISPSDNQGFWDGKAQKSNEGWKMVNTALYPFMKHKNSWLLQEPKSLVFVCPQAPCPSPVLRDHDKVHCLMSPLSSKEHRDCFCAEILV